MPDLSNEFQLNLPRSPSSLDPEIVRVLQPVHDAIHILAQYLDGRNVTNTITAATFPETTLRTSAINRMIVKAGGNILEGAPVYFVDVAGVLTAFTALATGTSTLAVGFCSQPGGVASGAYGEFTPAMGIDNIPGGGLVPGRTYYLQDGGGISSVSGTVSQKVGFAISSTKLLFMLGVH